MVYRLIIEPLLVPACMMLYWIKGRTVLNEMILMGTYNIQWKPIQTGSLLKSLKVFLNRLHAEYICLVCIVSKAFHDYLDLEIEN